MKHFSSHIAAILTFAVVVSFLLSTACAPNQSVVSAATPESTPTETAKPTATLSPSREPTPTPTATPEPTPEMTREEALQKLNITSEEIYSLADLVIYDCTLKDGRNCKFMTKQYFKNGEQGFWDIKVTNVIDGVTFATFSTNRNELSQINIMDDVDITLVPTFLQGAVINTTYGLSSMPWLFDPTTLPASNEYMKIILDMAEVYDTTGDLSKMGELNDIYLDATECANLLLDLVPLENMVWASDYIEGFGE